MIDASVAIEFYRTCLIALNTPGIDKLVVTLEGDEMEVNILEYGHGSQRPR